MILRPLLGRPRAAAFLFLGCTASGGLRFSGFAAGSSSDSYYSGSSVCITHYLADGYCDSSNNNEMCGYDYGDCCECTCADAFYICGVDSDFFCIDPLGALCSTDDTTTYGGSYTPTYGGSYTPTSGGSYTTTYGGSYTPTYGGGYTTTYSASDTTTYDGSDTPTHGGSYTTTYGGSYTTVYGGSYTPTYGGGYTTTYSGSDTPTHGGSYNTTYGASDTMTYGGSDTPTDGPSYTATDDDGAGSIDTTGDDDNTDEQLACQGDVALVSNGNCNPSNNNAVCDYDGGDCCACTCTNAVTGVCDTTFNCQDPDASCFEPSSEASSSSSTLPLNFYICIGAGVMAVLCIAAVVGYCCWRKKQNTPVARPDPIGIISVSGRHAARPPPFNPDALESATQAVPNMLVVGVPEGVQPPPLYQPYLGGPLGQ